MYVSVYQMSDPRHTRACPAGLACVALFWTHYLPKFYPDWPHTSTGLLILDLTFTDVGQLELGQASKWLHILPILAST